MQNKKNAPSGRLTTIFIVIPSILLMVLIFIFIFIMKDNTNVRKVLEPRMYSYYLMESDYRSISDHVKHDRSVRGSMEAPDEESSNYYAIADYYEARIKEEAAKKAGETEKADAFHEKAVTASAKCGDLSYAIEDIDKMLEGLE